jgi:micrococcal nuclease
MKEKRILLILIVMIFLCGCSDQEPESLFCVSVTDGDTFELNTGETVRLIGIDAPELFDPGGDISKMYLSYLISGKEILCNPGSEERDNYGRLLMVVYVGDICVNEAMILSGYAEARYLSWNDPLQGKYVQLEIEAERNNAGLWACGIFQPRENLRWEDDIPLISWEDASQHLGEYVIVEGTIVDTYTSGNVCFLHFHEEWDKYFSAVIFSMDLPSFEWSPEVYYLGKRVQIIGLLKEYKGSPEIIVKTPEQIRILEE